MIFLPIFLTLIAAGSAAPIVARDAATLKTDIVSITTAVDAFTKTTTAYDGTLFGALPVQQGEGAIDTAIKKATIDAGTTPISAADSAAILTSIKTTLTPAVDATLQAVVAKKAAFASAGATSVVTSDLTSLKTTTEAFGKALLAVADTSVKTDAQAEITLIDGYLTKASAAFA